MEKKEYLKPAVTKIELDDVQLMAASAPLLEMDFEQQVVDESEIG